MNATMNGSIASCSSLINPTARKVGETIAYCLILAVSLVGNSVIALIVYKTQSMRKPINFLIVNMAMSDLLFPIFVFPWQLIDLYVDYWPIMGPLGQALCKLVPFSMAVSMVVSIQSLVLIAVDRFGTVVFSLRSPLISSKRCPFFILATWIVAMAVFLPIVVLSRKRVDDQGQQYCVIQLGEVFEEFSEFSSNASYSLAIDVIFFYIPIALLAILYSIILIKLNSRKIPGEQSVNANERREKRNRNALKMATAIVLVFVLCWAPYSISDLLFYFAPDRLPQRECESELYWDIVIFMAYANCAMNPCICFISSGNYRRGLKKLLKCFG